MPGGSAIEELAARHNALISVWMGSLDGRIGLSRHADVVHPAASTMKLPLLVALYRAHDEGRLDLDTEVRVRAVLPSVVEGATYETTQDYDNDDEPWSRLGGTASLRWLGRRAIVRSSNLATNLLIDAVGIAAVNAVYDNAGASASRLRRGIQDEPAGLLGLSNTATAADLAAVLLGVARGQLASTSACGEVESVLAACQHDDALAAGLPAGTYLAHKTGWIADVCHDVGIVRPRDASPFVLAVLTSAALDEDAGHRLVADVARACWAVR